MRLKDGTEYERPNWRRRIGLVLAGITAIVIVYSLIYQWALFYFVDEKISLLQAIQRVIEILTTAGFGGDTDLWSQSDALAVLVIIMNLSGVLMVFLAIPLFAVPLFRQAFETRPATSSSLTDHVIICGFSPRDEVLRSELEAVGTPYVYLDPDIETVLQLTEEGVSAVLGDPARLDGLESVNVTEARAVVADIDDAVNPTVILSAKQLNPDIRAISVVENADEAPYHQYAGADEVVLARELLGRSMGLRAAATYAEKLQDSIEVESDVRITELLVENGSELVGQTLREANILDEYGVTVIGAWLGGKFVITPNPDTRIQPYTILLVAGEYDDEVLMPARRIPPHDEGAQRVVVCGFGTVGRPIVEVAHEEGIDTTVIDRRNIDGVDVVGDITDPEALMEADIAHARSIVLSLDEDTPTVYATLICEQLAPEVEIVARADDDETIQKLYSAGADFVLSLATVTGEILASHLIDEVEIVTPDTDFEFIRRQIPAFAGKEMWELDVRAETGCTIVAIERDEKLITDIGGGFTIEDEDVLIVAGSERARQRFADFVERFD